MATYRIGFYKHLTGSSGQPANCLQQIVEVHSARSADRAVKAAKYRFARGRGVRNWQLYADSIELQFNDAAQTEPQRPARMPPIRSRRRLAAGHRASM